MFVDSVELTISSGKGGAGCVSFRVEKFVVKGGPDGGDGGKGGSVFFEVDNNTDTLSALRGRYTIKAENGRPGEGKKCSGRKGKDAIITVPPGTQVIDASTGEILLDLLVEGEKVLFLEGGKGGLGNPHFRGPTNQRPTYAQPGLPGVVVSVRLELKSIADVGLVGFPNVGKSTLISTLSNARPQIANYEFTTLIPNLGVVMIGEYDSFMMADIPGIIEGASDGRGLGIEFLKHIERTKTLLYMIDATNYREMKYQYESLLVEINRYSDELSTRKHAIAITKVDSISVEETNALTAKFLADIGLTPNQTLSRYKADEQYLSYALAKEEWEEHSADQIGFVLPISSAAQINTQALRYALFDFIQKPKNAMSESAESDA